ncbi:hypothetical protein BCR35DRAFT_353435 [Leucosporidium creatinivorum]|uniref:Uncharacterized protein n=1 Tax=Leucosporidium creatinivorum TaxID=106004 RepID=A0A1Y2EXI2_9BASI|nr:hypothetical protein BCR35DRAFT_353435 [Leucosporidium creatinivorum]
MSNIPSQTLPAASAPAPLPSLPFELLSHIIHLVAEEYTCTFDPSPPLSPSSAKALASLSLVSRSFRQLAQPLLFHDVTIGSRVDLERWFATVGDIDLVWPLTVGRFVRTLRVGKLNDTTSLASMLWQGPLGMSTAEDYRLEELLRVCSRVRVLKLASVEKVDLESLRFAPELQSLYIWSCDLRLYDMPPARSALADDLDDEASVPVTPPSQDRWTPYLPNLRHLYLTDLSLTLPLVSSLLTPTALPSLTTLSFALNDFRDPTPSSTTWSLNAHSVPLATQVHSLSTSDSIDSTFSSATSLAFLDCWHLALTSSTILHLPHSLRFLRLNPLQSLKGDPFTSAWATNSSALPRLEEIWVPATYEEDNMFDELREVCKRRGVRLIYEERSLGEGQEEEPEEEGVMRKMDEDGAFDEMFWRVAGRVEKVLEEERRRGVVV